MLDLEATARLVGTYQWLEGRLFEVTGGWARSVTDLEAKQLLATQSCHHAWHAELWHRQLPSVPGLAPDRLSLGPDGLLSEPARQPALRELMEAVAEPEGPEDDGKVVQRLVGLYRVLLPRLLTTYRHHLEAASVVADGPIVRALELIVGDETGDWRRGESVLQSLITSSAAAQRAADRQARLETLLVTAGGPLFGAGKPQMHTA